MPYIKDVDRRWAFVEPIDKTASLISSKGDLNYAICELVGSLILKGKIGYTEISNWIDTLPDAEGELRRRLLHPYEDNAKEKNGDVPSFIRILELMK